MENFKLVIATNNPHKVKEIKKILSPYGIIVYSLKEQNIEPKEVEENGSTYFANALKKASEIARYTTLPVLADDSGIEIKAMNWKPGLKTARYANSFKNTYQDAFKEIYQQLKNEDRTARFICSIALVNLKEGPQHFEGVVPGKINFAPEGNNGFGYDPIFVCDELNKCYALLSEEEKNKVSHRGKALQLLVRFLKDHHYIDSSNDKNKS